MPTTDPTKYTDPLYAYFVYSLSSDAYVQFVYIASFSNLLSDGAMAKVLTFLTKAFKTGEVANTLHDFITGGEAIDNTGNDIIIYPEEVDAILNRLHIERVDMMKEVSEKSNLPDQSLMSPEDLVRPYRVS